jgi:hypothetical protein
MPMQRDMEKIIEKIIPYVPMVLLAIILIGFFISEWTGAFPKKELRSLMLLGQDKRIVLLG